METDHLLPSPPFGTAKKSHCLTRKTTLGNGLTNEETNKDYIYNNKCTVTHCYSDCTDADIAVIDEEKFDG